MNLNFEKNGVMRFCREATVIINRKIRTGVLINKYSWKSIRLHIVPRERIRETNLNPNLFFISSIHHVQPSVQHSRILSFAFASSCDKNRGASNYIQSPKRVLLNSHKDSAHHRAPPDVCRMSQPREAPGRLAREIRRHCCDAIYATLSASRSSSDIGRVLSGDGAAANRGARERLVMQAPYLRSKRRDRSPEKRERSSFFLAGNFDKGLRPCLCRNCCIMSSFFPAFFIGARCSRRSWNEFDDETFIFTVLVYGWFWKNRSPTFKCTYKHTLGLRSF